LRRVTGSAPSVTPPPISSVGTLSINA
jgi:hypothetical protein